MRILLIALLAAIVVPAPGLALDRHAVSSVRVHSGTPGAADGNGRRFGALGCDSRGERGHHDRRGSTCAVLADGWGYFDPNFNRSWDADSYNDWWHDRPDRAFPRWVQHNEGCDPDRMWWSGNG